MEPKLMKCKFCGGAKFKRFVRTTPSIVQIWDKDLCLEDEVVGSELDDETYYDYQCMKCKKKVMDGELDDLLEGAPFTK